MVLKVAIGSIRLPLNTNAAVMSLNHKTFFFTGFNDGTISSCEMNNVTSSDVHVDSCDGFNSVETCKDFDSVETCKDFDSVKSCEDFDSESVGFNSYLLLLNAARVMFTKAVAFSSVLTIRALLA